MATPASILKDIETALGPLIKAEKGELDVASDLDHALEKLATKVKGWRVVLLWDGHGPHELADKGASFCRLTTYIHVNLGLALPVGGKIYQGDDSVIARIEQVSKWCRALRWAHGHNVECSGLVLQDSDWVSAVQKQTRAHGLSWTLDYTLEFQTEKIIIPAPASN